MRKFALWMGRLPLAGKMAIRMLMFAVYTATTPRKRWICYFMFLVMIVILIYGHGVQASMGIEAIQFDSPTWAKVISILYVIVNCSVIVLHTYLGYRVTKHLRRGRYPKTRRKYVYHSGSEVITALLATFGGQLIFIAQYTWYFPVLDTRALREPYFKSK